MYVIDYFIYTTYFIKKKKQKKLRHEPVGTSEKAALAGLLAHLWSFESSGILLGWVVLGGPWPWQDE